VTRLTRVVVAALIAASVTSTTHAQATNSPPVVSNAQRPVAGDSALEARTSAVASQLRCPVCQGLSIQDSPAELAQQMRSLVREQLADGKTPDEVKSYFISKYGEWILLAPRPSGFNLLAYALPVFAVLGGGLVIVLAVRRWTTASPEAE